MTTPHLPANIFKMKVDSLPREQRHLVYLACEVWAGHDATRMYIQFFSGLERKEEVFRWLIRNKLVGKKLVDWVVYEHDGSPLRASAYVLMKINRDNILKPLIAGKDLR